MIFEKLILNIYKKTAFVRFDDVGDRYYFTAKDFEGLQTAPYEFKSKKGNLLKGSFYYYENYLPNRLIIFDHGMGGGHLSYMKEIQTIAKHGYLVLSYDHTGCMSSKGESLGGLSTAVSDLDDLINSLKLTKYKDLKISVIGHSFGGLAVVNIGALHPEVCHIVAISPMASVKKMLDQSFKGVLSLYKKAVYQLEKQSNPTCCDLDGVKAIKNTKAKVLIIQSKDDKLVNAKIHFDYLQTNLKDRPDTKFLLVNNKNHNPHYTTEAVSYLLTRLQGAKKIYKKGNPSAKEKQDFVKSYDWNRMTEQDLSVWKVIFETLDS